ncbi:alkyl sulfatase dimerization domain-containing protein [Leptospira terpstrae]|uniref:Metallo-beta-lactamase domain protein n=1 Tax=Leptospira terpstrae serovar Hualin str. LT 11-33 = ATCC 700639 TaxID=1257025 RepID=N1VJQ3_9LEPT|nr:alkyl sulfatase dimerization domain-containing protein [Leptospira terpstrae]EMY59969.1 metallo-beta-lactamase domain protein [Leptospira terpstrae serovar Hualin str. LT 11-33 = ATCC 700639]
MKLNLNFLILCLFFIPLFDCQITKPKEVLKGSHEVHLENLNAEFEKKIYEVVPGVFSAVGYGIANSMLIVGKDGLIIIDTLDELRASKQVLEDFRKISSLPIKAIIYTHSHPDHIFGSQSFVSGESPEVYAHESLLPSVQKLASETTPIIGTRSARMFGNYLEKSDLVNVGIGPYQGYNADTKLDFVPPTKTFRDTLEIEVAGIQLKLIHAPGETDDQIYIYHPEKNILFVGDNFYKAFPNLYTIRGTWFRSLKNWYESLDIIRKIKPEHLIPSHGKPVSGKSYIMEVVTDYRDAVQFVHDQSLRGINAGFHPDDLVEFVKLPDHLKKSPYLQEVYGKVSWSVRSAFTGNLGWFSGDSSELQPLDRKAYADLIVDLAGGKENLFKYTKSKLQSNEYQAVLTLSGYILRNDPNFKDVVSLRIEALEKLGQSESNANAKHYYLTEALELRNQFVAKIKVRPSPALLRRYPVKVILSSFVTNLDPELSANTDEKVGFIFEDTKETYTIHVRRGVAEVIPGLLTDAHLVVELNTQDWKEMLVRLKSPATTVLKFRYKKGNLLSFVQFLKKFSPKEQILSSQIPIYQSIGK